MKRNKCIKTICIVLCLSVLLFSGCTYESQKAQPKETTVFVTKDSSSSIMFPKTTWGMTPQEVFKAWNISFSDVELFPQSLIGEYREVDCQPKLGRFFVGQ